MISKELIIKYLVMLRVLKSKVEKVYIGVPKAPFNREVYKLNFINPLAWILAVLIWLSCLYIMGTRIIEFIIELILYLLVAIKSPFIVSIKGKIYDKENEND